MPIYLFLAVCPDVLCLKQQRADTRVESNVYSVCFAIQDVFLWLCPCEQRDAPEESTETAWRRRAAAVLLHCTVNVIDLGPVLSFSLDVLV